MATSNIDELRTTWYNAVADANTARDFLQWAEECGTLDDILLASERVNQWSDAVDRAFRAFAQEAYR